MQITELLLIAIGLSMDASAVSMTNGMCYRLKKSRVFAMALSFGVFQGIMPLIGYFVGSLFLDQIAAFDHWVALILLASIGGKMIWDGFHHNPECPTRSYSFGMLMMQAVATSIDALAIGVSFAAVQTPIWLAVSLIAAVTFLFSLISVSIGVKIGDRLNSKAEIFGGTILILIGLKILLQHLLGG